MSVASSQAVAATRLLIVDDDAVFRNRLATAFRNRGFDVTVAADCREALEVVARTRPDRVLVDLRMTECSGLTIVRDLQRIDPTIQTVVLTGYGSISTTVEAMRLGAVGYLTKPADADDILAAFDRLEHEEPAVEEFSPTDHEPPSLARTEWEHIHRVLADCGGNVSLAARKLGIHRRSLQRKLRRLAPE